MAKNDESRQVLILCSQPIDEPGTEAGAIQFIGADIEHGKRSSVLRDVGMHRVNDADVINTLGHMGKKVADPGARLAMPLELEWRREDCGGLALRSQVHLHGSLANVLPQIGLIVKGVDVRNAAVHQEMDYALGSRRQMRPLRYQGIGDQIAGLRR